MARRGVDYNLITNLGGAEARGRAQATSQGAGEAQLTDYLARTDAKTRAGGGDLAGFYEQETLNKNYQQDLQTNLPLLMQGMKVGNIDFVQKVNADMKAKYPTLHKTDIVGLVPGQSMDIVSVEPGASLLQKSPELAGTIDPKGSFEVSSTMGIDGKPRITGVKPAGAGKGGLEEWEPWGHGQKRNRRTGVVETIPVKPAGDGKGGAGSTSSLKWDKDALGTLKTQYGTLTDTGYVIDQARMAEYQDAITYLSDYKAKGLGPNEASVLAERRSKAGGVDPIQEVVDRYKAQGKSKKEIGALLDKSPFKSVNKRIYGL